jgi:hypothetical protein
MRSLVLVALAATACHRSPAASPPLRNAAAAPAPVARTSPYPPVHIEFMARGYFYASSEIDHGLGGNGTFDNGPRPNAQLAPAAHRRGSTLYVAVLADATAPFAKVYDGVPVVVVNASLLPVELQAQDSRLDIIQEAKDAGGVWKPIEFLPSSWCGNSYHTLGLPAGMHWAFVAPRYAGTFATTLRVKVVAGAAGHEEVLYSNEFAGSVNPAQFTDHQPPEERWPFTLEG